MCLKNVSLAFEEEQNSLLFMVRADVYPIS